jgi:hypothetical protein
LAQQLVAAKAVDLVEMMVGVLVECWVVLKSFIVHCNKLSLENQRYESNTQICLYLLAVGRAGVKAVLLAERWVALKSFIIRKLQTNTKKNMNYAFTCRL